MAEPTRCAYCHAPLDGFHRQCPSCRTALHEECARSLGRCPTLGCPAGSSLGATTKPAGWRWRSVAVVVGVLLCLWFGWAHRPDPFGPRTPSAEEQERLDRARELVEQARGHLDEWRRAADPGGRQRSFGVAAGELREAMDLTRDIVGNIDWRGTGWPVGAVELLEEIGPLVWELEQGEWAPVHSQLETAPRPPASPLLGTIDPASPLLPGTDLRLGATHEQVAIAVVGSGADPRSRGVVPRYVGGALVSVEFVFHADSITFFPGDDFRGRVWGVLGPELSRGDIVAAFGPPNDAPVAAPNVTYVKAPPADTPPQVLTYVRGPFRIAFQFYRGEYATLAAVSVARTDARSGSGVLPTVGSEGRWYMDEDEFSAGGSPR